MIRGTGRKLRMRILALLLTLQLALMPGMIMPVLACGPFFDQTIFSLSLHPDAPFKFYAKGQLGIIKPTYDNTYRIVAYRYLNDRPLNAQEQAGYLSYWGKHANQFFDYNTPDSDKWLKDRAKVGGKLDPALAYTSVYRSVSESDDGWSQYLNCGADAFKTASATLAKIVTKYGAESPVAKEWVKGQDRVFCHCQSPAYDYKAKKQGSEPPFPDKLPESAALEQRQDRQYQLAAAYFYAQKFDDAISLFSAIGADKSSPWHNVARYMVARSLIRKGTLSKKEGFDSEILARALTALKQLAGTFDNDSLNKSVTELTDFVELRLHPDACCFELGKLLGNPYTGDDLPRKLDNYIFVNTSPAPNKEDPEDKWDTWLKAKPPKAEGSPLGTDLSNWLACFSVDPKEYVAETEAIFKKHHNLAWAIAYATKLKGTEPQAEEVEKVLAKVSQSDPGYLSACYYRAVLLQGGKKDKEAEAVVAAALQAPNMTPSALNDLYALKLHDASTLEQFLTLSFRPPAAIVGGEETNEMSGTFDEQEKKSAYSKLSPTLMPESARLINSSFPLSYFVQSVSSKGMTPAYAKQFAQAAFVRAILLGDYATAMKVTGEMKKGYPALAKQITDFENAAPADKQFAAIFLILKTPGMRPTVTGGTGRGTPFDRIDDYQDNWWDKEIYNSSGDRGGPDADDKTTPPLVASFLSAADRELAKSQIAKMQAIGVTPNYMGKIVMAYAKTHLSDPRVPEALHLAVKATHFGEVEQEKVTAVSTQVFQLLHKNYPGNPWTKKTPYHY